MCGYLVWKVKARSLRHHARESERKTRCLKGLLLPVLRVRELYCLVMDLKPLSIRTHALQMIPLSAHGSMNTGLRKWLLSRRRRL